MNVTLDAATLLSKHADATSRYLREEIPRLLAFDAAPPRLVEAVTYSLMAGGKRLRPALVLECHAAAGDSASQHASPLPAAAAVELVHTFSLVHDDLPAMDDDELRRGRPTNHKVFGEAMAILAGDAMMTLAFELLATAHSGQPELAGSLIRELACAAGPAGMIGGQVLDMAGENQALAVEQLRDIHRRKTGALITGACRMGAMAAGAGAEALSAVTAYGQHLGLAFQIADDLLDVTASSEATGKATRKDAAAGKNTYPALLGPEAARAAARSESEAAIAAVSPLGSKAAGLRLLARLAVERTR
jgi:geranylgeranyl diphosphate synthase type II